MTRAAEMAKIVGKGSVDIHGEAGTTSSGSTGKTTNLQQGLVKAWSVFDGRSTPSFYDSFNTASITDNGTGNYLLNFTNGFSTKNYGTVLSHQHTVSNSGADATPTQSDSTTTTTAVRIEIYESDAARDPVYCNALLAGDLA